MGGFSHFPHISPVGAPPHIGPIVTSRPTVFPVPPVTGVGVGVGVGIIFIAILILIALGVIF
ncbi:hypothetical protein Desde_3983 [Desulfitobacterium dehalogenans ATCC 51507]|uniref:Uncharacterized protein n=1 Tax=Desulfitobacterium dehalogenans (strain ATCC 51507 / DSM 9161 / JW/IU-DC1) TaxID=756499 RepID=I4AE62_DESDJ|nr:hypothetical protein [Desulfitobacterium dehalogenans]AFM02247.1 hypothetical protein Desde_3983 [Desulfitobacterium dehalogenans ATCC 51507]